MTFFGLSQTPPPTFSFNFVLLQGRMGLKLLLLSAGLILITPGQHHHHKYLCIIAFAINTRDAKSSECGEHARTIFSLLLCYFLVRVHAQYVHWCLFLAPAVLMFGPNSLGN